MNPAGQRDTRGKEDVRDRLESILFRIETTRDDFWSSRCEVDMPYDGGSGDVMKVFRENEQFQLAMEKAWSTLAENAVDAEPVRGMQGAQDSAAGEGSLLNGSETVIQADTDASAATDDGDKEKWRSKRPEALRLSRRTETSPTLGEKIREVGRKILSEKEDFGEDGRGDCNKKTLTPQKLGDCSTLESATEAGARPIYGECRRNLAADKGTVAFDGCGEFLAAGEDGSPDAFKCAACSCHRNFHRRVVDVQTDEPEYVLHRHEETESEDSNLIFTVKRLASDVKTAISQVLPVLAADLQKKGKERELFSADRSNVIKKCLDVLEYNARLMLATTECLSYLHSGTHEVRREKSLQGLPALMTPCDASSAVKEGKFANQALIPVRITGNSLHHISPLPEDRLPSNTHMQKREHNEKRKRKRTKFTVEQLEKLQSFAERVKWTLSGLRKEDIESICLDIGIEAITLRYWLHNSKQKSRKKSCDEDGSCSRSPEHN